MTESTGTMHVDTALVRELAAVLDESNLTEVEVQDGERRIRVARTVTVTASVASAPAPSGVFAGPAASGETPASTPGADPVKSPMVGTVFLAAEPGAKPFASVGDTVSEGQTLVIIEAMKVMNPIAAPRSGKVTRVCVENGQPVEFDQPLIVIE